MSIITLGVANGLGEHWRAIEQALFFASTGTLTFCHLRAASILKKRLGITEQIKMFGEQRANKKQFAKN